MWRPGQHLSDFVLDHAVFLGDALAEVHELKPRFDQVGFLEAAEFGHVLEHAPGERAVAAALLAQIVDGAQKALAILRIDPVLDLDQNRPAVVRDVLDRLWPPVVEGRREIDGLGVVKLPGPGQRDGEERAGRRREKRPVRALRDEALDMGSGASKLLPPALRGSRFRT